MLVPCPSPAPPPPSFSQPPQGTKEETRSKGRGVRTSIMLLQTMLERKQRNELANAWLAGVNAAERQRKTRKGMRPQIRPYQTNEKCTALQLPRSSSSYWAAGLPVFPRPLLEDETGMSCSLQHPALQHRLRASS